MTTRIAFATQGTIVTDRFRTTRTGLRGVETCQIEAQHDAQRPAGTGEEACSESATVVPDIDIRTGDQMACVAKQHIASRSCESREHEGGAMPTGELATCDGVAGTAGSTRPRQARSHRDQDLVDGCLPLRCAAPRTLPRRSAGPEWRTILRHSHSLMQ